MSLAERKGGDNPDQRRILDIRRVHFNEALDAAHAAKINVFDKAALRRFRRNRVIDALIQKREIRDDWGGPFDGREEYPEHAK